MQAKRVVSVIIPACNEARFIGGCLGGLATQQIDSDEITLEVIVAANACRDDTVAVVCGWRALFEARGWRLTVLDLIEGGKTKAMNAACQVATGDITVFLDADVRCEPDVIAQLAQTLRGDAPSYASGRLAIPPARSWWSRAYARIWLQLPFAAHSVPGAGLFAVNAAGRRRWRDFPETFADDLFVRLLFAPQERHQVTGTYWWPIAEGFRSLVSNRRRQNYHATDILRRFPRLAMNEDKPALRLVDLAWILLRAPLSAGVYGAVLGLSRLGGAEAGTFRCRDVQLAADTAVGPTQAAVAAAAA